MNILFKSKRSFTGTMCSGTLIEQRKWIDWKPLLLSGKEEYKTCIYYGSCSIRVANNISNAAKHETANMYVLSREVASYEIRCNF